MTDNLTTAEAAHRLKVSTRTVQRWARAGSLPGAYKLNPKLSNSHYIIPTAAVEALLASRR